MSASDDNGNLAASDVTKCFTWKEHYFYLYNVEFPLDSDGLVEERNPPQYYK